MSFGDFWRIHLVDEGGMVLGGSGKVCMQRLYNWLIGYSDIRLSKFRHRT